MPLPYRVDWLDEAKADVWRLDRLTAMRVFDGILHYARTGGGNIEPLHGDMTGLSAPASATTACFSRSRMMPCASSASATAVKLIADRVFCRLCRNNVWPRYICAKTFDGSRLTTSLKSRLAEGQSLLLSSCSARSSIPPAFCESSPKPITDKDKRQHSRTRLERMLFPPSLLEARTPRDRKAASLRRTRRQDSDRGHSPRARLPRGAPA